MKNMYSEILAENILYADIQASYKVLESMWQEQDKGNVDLDFALSECRKMIERFESYRKAKKDIEKQDEVATWRIFSGDYICPNLELATITGKYIDIVNYARTLPNFYYEGHFGKIIKIIKDK